MCKEDVVMSIMEDETQVLENTLKACLVNRATDHFQIVFHGV